MRGWVHHIDLTVSDLGRSGPFYDAVLGFLGYARAARVRPGLTGTWALSTAHPRSASGRQETIDAIIAIPADFITWPGLLARALTLIVYTKCSSRLERRFSIRRRTIPTIAKATMRCFLQTLMA